MEPTVLWTIVPGFGGPHVEKKLEILDANLASLSRGPWATIVLYLYVYDSSDACDLADIYKVLAKHAPKVKPRVFERPGVVGQFLAEARTAPRMGFDQVCLLLDDVELQADVDWHAACVVAADLGLDILSPSLTADSPTSYPYMRADGATSGSGRDGATSGSGRDGATSGSGRVDLVNACEFFCYLMTLAGFEQWMGHYSRDNPWLWGMDLILRKHMGLRVGMLRSMTARHHFAGTAYDGHPAAGTHAQMTAYLARYGETQATLAQQPAVRYMVYEIPR